MKNLFLLPALIVGLGFSLTSNGTAQTFTTIYSFTGAPGGRRPTEGSIFLGNTLYGTTFNGGTANFGMVFAVNVGTPGSPQFTNVHSFSPTVNSLNYEGVMPNSGLIYSGGKLYGTANTGGTAGHGAIFGVHPDGTGFQNLHSFSGTSDGTYPRGVISSGGILYGVTHRGGQSDAGTIFSLGPNGLLTLHHFTSISNLSFTNIDGAHPEGSLTLSGGTLYGTAERGGTSGRGTVFSIRTNGTSFTNLHNFSSGQGGYPNGFLVASGSMLYGTASSGAGSPGGTVFKLTTNGTGLATLHTFTGRGTSPTNYDGSEPYTGLILSGDTLYGTAVYGGAWTLGTVFSVRTDGTGFTNLHNFTGTNITSNGGAFPTGLAMSGNTLYGTTDGGIRYGAGTVFSISWPQPPAPPGPTLRIFRNEANPTVILVWPTNVAGFTLQSTTNLVPPIVWHSNLPAPVVIGAQNRVTDKISGPQKFYRLLQ